MLDCELICLGRRLLARVKDQTLVQLACCSGVSGGGDKAGEKRGFI